MATKTYTVTYKGSVTPKATTFLKSDAIVMDFTGSIDLDETDASHLAAIQTAFQSEMDKNLKTQLSHLNTWLSEKDKTIDDMVKTYNAMKKAGLPSTSQQASARAQQIKEMGTLAAKIQLYPEDYKEIVSGWAVNAREQQGLVAMVTAVKTARVKTFSDKTWRVRAGQALKITLVILAIAVSIAAIVVSAGSTAPIFIGLAAAGASIAGISSLTGLGKTLVENATIEKKLMANLAKDVEAVKNAMNPLNSAKTNIAKHVTELKNLMKIREDNIKKYNTEIQKQTVAVKSYTDALAGLKKDPSVDPADIAKRQTKIDGLTAGLKSVSDKIKKLEADNAAGQKVLDELEALNVDLEKISGQGPNTLLGNLKSRFTGLDGWVDLGNTVGGLVNSASGIHT